MAKYFFENELKNYDLIVFETLDNVHPLTRFEYFVTQLDEALLQFCRLSEQINNPKPSVNELHSMFGTSMIHLAYLDEPLYKRISQALISKIDQSSHKYFNTIYYKVRTMIAQNNLKVLQHSMLDLRPAITTRCMLALIKVSMQHLLAAKLDEIQMIVTNTTYAKDGKIPIKLKDKQLEILYDNFDAVITKYIPEYFDFVSQQYITGKMDKPRTTVLWTRYNGNTDLAKFIQFANYSHYL